MPLKLSKESLDWPALTLEGNLITSAMASRIAHLEAPRQTETDYFVHKGLSLREAISASFRIGQSHYLEYSAKTKEPSLAATQLFVRNFLDESFGFTDLSDGDGEIAFFAGSRIPIVVVPASDQNLDKRSKTLSTHRPLSPALVLQNYLGSSQTALWGLVTNSTVLRLVRRSDMLTRITYIEADLHRIFVTGDNASFALLWLLIHRSRFGTASAAPSDCILEHWREMGAQQGVVIRDQLAGQVEIALKALGSGFLQANPGLSVQIKASKINLTQWFNELLRLVYRLIFLMVAEARGLLHSADTLPQAHELYAGGYAIALLRAKCIRFDTWKHQFYDYYEGVKIVFKALGSGQNALGLSALGGLFEIGKLGYTETARLPNHALMDALYRISWIYSDGCMFPVDWQAMETEELGSVYESLLELQPQLSNDGKTLVFATENAQKKGNQRKTTGSYYTPDSLVQLVLDTTLDPVLNDRESLTTDPVKELLNLTVIDPACGSGHFLLAAARRIATRVAYYRVGGIVTAGDYRQALSEVICRCLYGVDRNPMAVELAKVALWIESLEPGRPLAFFDIQIKCGDSLLGVFNQDMLLKGIPDAAYKSLTGSDEKLALEYARINKKQKEKATKPSELIPSSVVPEILTIQCQAPKAMAQDNLVEPRAKEALYASMHKSEKWQRLKIASDIYISTSFYVAVFFTPKTPLVPGVMDAIPLTEHVWRSVQGLELPEHLLRGARITSEKISAFHWFLEFPEIMEREQGFDVVIGNPPWERIKLQEQEFFAVSAPEIANAPNKAMRQVLVDALRQAAPDSADNRLWRDFVFAKRVSEAGSEFARSSGRYPLTGRGDVNTYALFAELFLQLIKPTGRAGMLVPTGIATDMTTSLFFSDLVSKKYLSQLIDFENREKLFPDVDSRMRFSALAMGASEKASFTFFLTNTAQLAQGQRRFTLSPQEIALINPNTRTAPIFRSRTDANLTAKLYTRAPVLIEEQPTLKGGNVNPWNIMFQRMFHLSDDSVFFRTAAQMSTSGWVRSETDWIKETKSGVQRYVPLYEAKMIHHFNHRWATFDTRTTDGKEYIRKCTPLEKQSPDFEPSPRYWVPQQEVILRAARVPVALKGIVGQLRDAKGHKKSNATSIEKARLIALKTLAIWIAGAISTIEQRAVVLTDIIKVLGQEQNWRAALGVHPAQFFTNPDTCAVGVQMQKESPLLAADLEYIADAPRDPLNLAQLLIEIKQPRWFIGWRDITNATNERTIIANVFPKVGIADTLLTIHFGIMEPRKISALLAYFSSLVCDYIIRQKISGTHLNFFHFCQLAAFPPASFSKYDLDFINSRVLELTYTSYSMKPWAEDLGYSGSPFAWDEDRRAQLRAQLDVFFARKYDLTQEELKFILDPAKVKGENYPSETFRVLKEKEIKEFGEYRTERLILNEWEQMGY
jgi:hypothetical protein